MNRNLYQLLTLLIVMVAFSGTYIFTAGTGYYLGLILLFVLVELLNHFQHRAKIKTGSELKIGKRKEALWYSLFFVGLGLLFLWSCYSVNSLTAENSDWNHFDLFIGFTFILIGLFRIRRHHIYLTQDGIILYEFLKRKEWKMHQIETVIIDNNSVHLHLFNFKKEFDFSSDPDDILKIKAFLAAKLLDRLKIKRNE